MRDAGTENSNNSSGDKQLGKGKIGLLAPESAPFTTRLPLNAKLLGTRKASKGDLVQCQQVGEENKEQKTKEISLKPRTSSNTSLFSSLLQDASLLTKGGGMLSGQR